MLGERGLASLSPNGRLVAFGLSPQPNASRIHVAVAGHGQPPVPITDGEGQEYNPVFRADGGAVRFLSERDGEGRCVFEQSIDAWTGRPKGVLRTLVHLHRPSRTTLWGWPTMNGLAGGGQQVYLRAKDEQAIVWMLR